MKFKTYIIMIIFFLLYTVIGGIIFRYIEIYNEEKFIQNSNKELNEIINSTGINSKDLEEFQSIVMDMNLYNVLLEKKAGIFYRSSFDVRSSIFLSSCLFSGIGLRNAYPSTNGGKVLNTFYSLFSSYYTFFIMYTTGKIFDMLLKYIYKKINKKNKIKKVHYFYHFRQIILSIIGIIFFLLIPSFIIYSIEPWSFWETLYFCITFLLTIGFGEFVPGTSVYNYSENFILWYRLGIGFWLQLSILWFAVIIYQFKGVFSSLIWKSSQEIIEDRIKKIKKRFFKKISPQFFVTNKYPNQIQRQNQITINQ